MLAVFIAIAPAKTSAEVTEVRLVQQFGATFLPAMVIESQNLVEKHLAKAGLANSKVVWSKLGGPGEMLELMTEPGFEYTRTPKKIGKFIEFMHKTGMIKTKPASWKELFFEEAHALPGD